MATASAYKISRVNTYATHYIWSYYKPQAARIFIIRPPLSSSIAYSSPPQLGSHRAPPLLLTAFTAVARLRRCDVALVVKQRYAYAYRQPITPGQALTAAVHSLLSRFFRAMPPLNGNSIR